MDGIRATYTQEKKAIERMIGFWCYRVMRPLSFYPTWFFLKLGVTANQVSALGIAFQVSGFYCLLIDKYWVMVMGAVFLNISALLDYVDGNIARYNHKAGSPMGVFLERLCAYLDKGLFALCTGIAASYNPIFNISKAYSWVFIVLGAWTSVITLITPFVTARLQNLTTIKEITKSENAREYRTLEGFTFYRLARAIIGGSYVAVLLVCAVLNQIGISLIMQTLTATGMFGLIMLKVLAQIFGRKQENSTAEIVNDKMSNF